MPLGKQAEFLIDTLPPASVRHHSSVAALQVAEPGPDPAAHALEGVYIDFHWTVCCVQWAGLHGKKAQAPRQVRSQYAPVRSSATPAIMLADRTDRDGIPPQLPRSAQRRLCSPLHAVVVVPLQCSALHLNTRGHRLTYLFGGALAGVIAT